MARDELVLERLDGDGEPDPDEIPIRDRKLITQPYDLVVEALVTQIKGNTIFLRPLSERPHFQRNYVWGRGLASRLIESILLNVPIPPCYLSQNEDFELDVIDGQQRLYSIFTFLDNRFALTDLEVLTELNGSSFYKLSRQLQRKLTTHTLRCILITNESHPEIKFDVFERLNTNTTPLNAQELRNCVFRGALNDLLHEVVGEKLWLDIRGAKGVDKRMRDQELALRFFAFWGSGVESYRTPLKHWLNAAAKDGRKYSTAQIADRRLAWERGLTNSLIWFSNSECFRRMPFTHYKSINRSLFDLVMTTAARMTPEQAHAIRGDFRKRYSTLLKEAEFGDLISRAVDHTKRTKRRFEIWNDRYNSLI